MLVTDTGLRASTTSRTVRPIGRCATLPGIAQVLSPPCPRAHAYCSTPQPCPDSCTPPSWQGLAEARTLQASDARLEHQGDREAGAEAREARACYREGARRGMLGPLKARQDAHVSCPRMKTPLPRSPVPWACRGCAEVRKKPPNARTIRCGARPVSAMAHVGVAWRSIARCRSAFFCDVRLIKLVCYFKLI